MIVLAIVEIIALWRIFTKAGEQGWKCLIPIYNLYILFKIAKNNGFLKLVIAVAIFIFVALIGNLCLPYMEQYKYDNIVLIVGLECFLAFYIYLLVVLYKMFADLSERFGQERIFALGILFLTPIFVCILGFGKAKYRAGAAEVNNVLTDTDDKESFHNE